MTKKKTRTKSLKKLVETFGVKDFKTNETFQFLLGLLLMFVAVFLSLAFISYITTGYEDQSSLESLHNIVGVDKSDLDNLNIHNSMGVLGAKMAYYFLQNCFGLPSFFIPLFFIFMGLKLMRTYKINPWRKFVEYAFLMLWFSVSLSFFLTNSICANLCFPPGGDHGNYICSYLTSLIGKPGLFIIIIVTAIAYLIYLSQRTITIIQKLIKGEYFKKNKLLFSHHKVVNNLNYEVDSGTSEVLPIHENEKSNVIDLTDPESFSGDVINNTKENYENNTDSNLDNTFESPRSKSNGVLFGINKGKEDDKAKGNVLVDGHYNPKLDLEFYKYPPLSLLKSYENKGPTIDMEEQKANKERITTILHNFGVEITSIKATVGPTITLYEITPAQGVRIAKIRNLEDDIALSLSAIGIRIIAPIPGKGTIGIEVPNRKPQIVSGESILNSKKFQECDFELPIALGKTITNEVYMVDLAKMPHLLVAGATGQGKSVGLNAIITSLLYKKHPSELKMVLIDPKKVEFSIYAPLINHFLALVPNETDPIVTDVTKVVHTLKSLCQEMDDRYVLLKKAGCRNIKEYNEKFKARELNPEKGHRYLPYFVIIIDEFGDLIMTAGKEVELPIARIAQLARAVGMHMIIATQRPTTNIITGTIKANFPARMAFKVLAQIDSRTILDQGGANQLVGKGDMLILAGTSLPIRVQCAFIDTPEVQRINEFISSQQGYPEPYRLPEVVADSNDDSGRGSENGDIDKLDAMFEEVARLIVLHQQGSTSLIQRRFSIGYNRAGRLMDQLERAGIVGPAQGSKPRDVLCADEIQLQQKLNKYRL